MQLIIPNDNTHYLQSADLCPLRGGRGAGVEEDHGPWLGAQRRFPPGDSRSDVPSTCPLSSNTRRLRLTTPPPPSSIAFTQASHRKLNALKRYCQHGPNDPTEHWEGDSRDGLGQWISGTERFGKTGRRSRSDSAHGRREAY